MHCDRIEFTKNMNCNISLEELFKGYFDETMAVYDLVESYCNCKIKSCIDNRFELTLVFKNKKDSLSAFNILKTNNIIYKYDRVFNYYLQHIGKEIIITIEEVVDNE